MRWRLGGRLTARRRGICRRQGTRARGRRAGAVRLSRFESLGTTLQPSSASLGLCRRRDGASGDDLPTRFGADRPVAVGRGARSRRPPRRRPRARRWQGWGSGSGARGAVYGRRARPQPEPSRSPVLSRGAHRPVAPAPRGSRICTGVSRDGRHRVTPPGPGRPAVGRTGSTPPPQTPGRGREGRAGQRLGRMGGRRAFGSSPFVITATEESTDGSPTAEGRGGPGTTVSSDFRRVLGTVQMTVRCPRETVPRASTRRGIDCHGRSSADAESDRSGVDSSDGGCGRSRRAALLQAAIPVLTRPFPRDTVVARASRPGLPGCRQTGERLWGPKSPLPGEDGLIGPLRSFEGAEERRVPWCTGTYCASIRTGPNSDAGTGSIRHWGSRSSPVRFGRTSAPST